MINSGFPLFEIFVTGTVTGTEATHGPKKRRVGGEKKEKKERIKKRRVGGEKKEKREEKKEKREGWGSRLF